MLRAPRSFQIAEAIAAAERGDREPQTEPDRQLAHEQRWRGRPEIEIRAEQEAAIERWRQRRRIRRMALIKIKSGVEPRSLYIVAAAGNVAQQMDGVAEIVITSGNDSKHKRGSLHYRDRAVDFRTRNLTDQQLNQFVALLQARLGAGYQLIVEQRGQPNEHLHVEYDPPDIGTANT